MQLTGFCDLWDCQSLQAPQRGWVQHLQGHSRASLSLSMPGGAQSRTQLWGKGPLCPAWHSPGAQDTLLFGLGAHQDPQTCPRISQFRLSSSLGAGLGSSSPFLSMNPSLKVWGSSKFPSPEPEPGGSSRWDRVPRQ